MSSPKVSGGLIFLLSAENSEKKGNSFYIFPRFMYNRIMYGKMRKTRCPAGGFGFPPAVTTEKPSAAGARRGGISEENCAFAPPLFGGRGGESGGRKFL